MRHRHQLSALITDVVKGWDAKEVSGKLEAEIGRDLQYIRINGTFVGGTVGVLIHACVLLVAAVSEHTSACRRARASYV